LGVAPGDPCGQLIEIEVGVVQDALARSQTVDSLAQFSASVRLDQFHDVADFEIRCGIGDTGDPVSAQLTTHVGQARIVTLQCVRPAAVRTAQPAVGVILQPDPFKPGRVKCPQHAAAVLYAYRHRR
jgi:hypothetical protein